MRLPVVIPAHEYSLSETVKWLEKCKNEYLSGFGGNAAESLESYQRGTVQLSKGLDYIFSHDDVETMLLTRRHWLLMQMSVAGNGPVIHDLIQAESTERQRFFDELAATYQKALATWGSSTTKLLIADTNVYEHNEEYWDEINWVDLAGTADVRLLVPNAVVRELDRHKRSPQNQKVSDTNDEMVRSRARVSTRRLRAMFGKVDEVRAIKSGASAELLIDPPGHVPSGDPDAEIIDRALAAHWFTQRPVTLVTGDGNMQFAAEAAGLNVINVYEADH